MQEQLLNASDLISSLSNYYINTNNSDIYSNKITISSSEDCSLKAYELSTKDKLISLAEQLKELISKVKEEGLQYDEEIGEVMDRINKLSCEC